MLDCYTPFTILLAWVHSDSVRTQCLAALENESVRYDGTFSKYLSIFALTCLIEFPFYWMAGKRAGRKIKDILAQTIILNLATHPLVLWVFPLWGEIYGLNMLQTTTFSELFALIVEALLMFYLFRFSWRIAFTTSLLANLASWWLGAYIPI